MSALDRDEVIARLRAWETQSCGRDLAVRELGALTGDALTAELAMVDAALRYGRSRWYAIAIYGALVNLSRQHPQGQARLTAAARGAIVRRVATRAIGAGEAERLGRSLVEADEHTYRRIAEPLLAIQAPNFDNGHSIMVQALRAAPAEALPLGPLHAGGQMPTLSSRAYVALALFCAERVAPLADAADRPRIEAALAIARDAVENGRREVFPANLDKVTNDKTRTPAFVAARAAAMETRTFYLRPDLIGAALRPAIGKAVKLVLEVHGVEGLRDFLLDLDEEILRLDCVTALERQEKTATSPIAHALWRGVTTPDKKAGDQPAKVNHWLARLENGRYGLLAKLGRRWAWTEGPRDDVLATVPEALFAEAVREVLARDAPEIS